tara:strand:- start:263 stop:508 length:246 start_codon:yes stop_codon:yes gene_type:complete
MHLNDTLTKYNQFLKYICTHIRSYLIPNDYGVENRKLLEFSIPLAEERIKFKSDYIKINPNASELEIQEAFSIYIINYSRL